MCMDYTFCKGSMEACATQQEIFDEIEESDDEPTCRCKSCRD